MRVLRTRAVGLAPDARGREHPPEIVYLCEETPPPPRRPLAVVLLDYGCNIVMVSVLLAAIARALGPNPF